MSTAFRLKEAHDNQTCFVRALPLGTFAIRPLDPIEDANLVHDWVRRDYARYWNMATKSATEVAQFYAELCTSAHAMAYLGLVDEVPAFLVERYDPAFDEIAAHYEVRSGDRGMHLLVAPPVAPRAGFTFAVMRTVMDFLFAYPSVRRVVVEPDIRNDKIHALNRRAGFRYDRRVTLREKTAYLAFCTREDYAAALADEAP